LDLIGFPLEKKELQDGYNNRKDNKQRGRRLSMKFHGMLLDCARLIEKHDYYYKVIDTMAENRMNILILHFSDDHGCSIRLPGFEELAPEHAFTPAEIRKLVAYAESKGIDVIPELETFGHTRYITDRPQYAHLAAKKKDCGLTFNAIDPLSPESWNLMARLICSVTSLFNSNYFHVGGDEVDLSEYCAKRKIKDEEAVWAGYVNRMISLVFALGKVPIIWGDHLRKSARICELLDKNVIVCDWRYEAELQESVVPRLKRAGFKNIICCPSLASGGYRFLPGHRAFSNTAGMIRQAFRYGALGVIHTVWYPTRYVQSTLMLGIDFAAYAFNKKGDVAYKVFADEFCRKVFGSQDKMLRILVEMLPDMEMGDALAQWIIHGRRGGKTGEKGLVSEAERLMRSGLLISELAPRVKVKKNKDILDGLLLASECGLLCGGYFMMGGKSNPIYRKKVEMVIRKLEKDWDHGRFKDDPQKLKPMFPGEEASSVLSLVRSLG
jgi:hypothetical protein